MGWARFSPGERLGLILEEWKPLFLCPLPRGRSFLIKFLFPHSAFSSQSPRAYCTRTDPRRGTSPWLCESQTGIVHFLSLEVCLGSIPLPPPLAPFCKELFKACLLFKPVEFVLFFPFNYTFFPL